MSVTLFPFFLVHFVIYLLYVLLRVSDSYFDSATLLLLGSWLEPITIQFMNQWICRHSGLSSIFHFEVREQMLFIQMLPVNPVFFFPLLLYWNFPFLFYFWFVICYLQDSSISIYQKMTNFIYFKDQMQICPLFRKHLSFLSKWK